MSVMTAGLTANDIAGGVDKTHRFSVRCCSPATGRHAGLRYNGGQADCRHSMGAGGWGILMRKLLLSVLAVAGINAGPALAADMPVKAQSAPAVSVSWTGFYVGANGGAGWSDRKVRFSGDNLTGDGAGNWVLNGAFGALGFFPSERGQVSKKQGFVGGFQAGYNRQWDQFLLGVEADIQGARISGRGSNSATVLEPIAITSEQRLDWFGTVRARAGVLLWDQRLLAYATGGLAFGHTEVSGTNLTRTFGIISLTTTLNCIAPTCLAGSGSRTSAGWTAGGGVELMLAGNVRLKAEYLHVDLGEQSIRMVAVAPSTGTGFVNAKFDNSFEIVRVGLNFGF
jgi:outer membrane immunogenic protein